MKFAIGLLVVLVVITGFAERAHSQANEICSEFGGSVWLDARVVYGVVTITGIDSTRKFPKVTVSLTNGGRSLASQTVDRSGKYCFRDVDGGGGTLIVEYEGIEAGRQILPQGTRELKQFQQDFAIDVSPAKTAKPGVVSAKQGYQRSEKNTAMFEEASTARKSGKLDKAVPLFKEIVKNDPGDYVSWGQLGAIYYEQDNFAEAETAYQKALAAKPELSAVMTNLGRIYYAQKKFEQAIEILEKATQTDPTSAKAFQLLGESYIYSRKGSLGVAALNEAIRLDPIGMAESHLLMARLYDAAGLKNLASKEFRMFLEKVPQHTDRKKLEQYIKENPE
ncbi:MAG: tetratricopeptide repeat protein [Pyrinomonadaceae bacterium]